MKLTIGTKYHVTAVPNRDYACSDILINGESTKDKGFILNNAIGLYDFVMDSSINTIDAVFDPIPVTEQNVTVGKETDGEIGTPVDTENGKITVTVKE